MRTICACANDSVLPCVFCALHRKPTSTTARGGTHRSRSGIRGATLEEAQQQEVVPRPTPPQRRSAATWTAQVGEVTSCFVSHARWRHQPRPLRGADPAIVAATFRGMTLQDRHPSEPAAVYTAEEAARLCSVCGALVVHQPTYEQGPRHTSAVAATAAQRPDVGTLEASTAAVPPVMSTSSGVPAQDRAVAAAIEVLRAFRPDLFGDAAPQMGSAGPSPHPGSQEHSPQDPNPVTTSPSPASLDMDIAEFLGPVQGP